MKILQLSPSSSIFFMLALKYFAAHMFKKLPGVRHLKARGRGFWLGYVVQYFTVECSVAL